MEESFTVEPSTIFGQHILKWTKIESVYKGEVRKNIHQMTVK